MKVAVFGSTGGTGLELIKQALELGYEVTAFARTPAKLDGLRNENLKIVRGDVKNPAEVDTAVAGQQAVISALGSPTLKSGDTTVSEGTKNIIEAMKKHGVRRLVCETALGVGDSSDQPGFFLRKIFIPLVLKNVFPEKEIQEEHIRKSGLDWIIVRPGGLTNGRKTSRYRHGLDKNISGRISRADVAQFMLAQLESDRYLHQTPAITY
jgi:putative NADH-flavin reductase